jgi:hypothetical protein
MSLIYFCDGCGKELGKGKGIYHVKVQQPSEPFHHETNSCELCAKCAKPLVEWKRAHPKRNTAVAEAA